MKHLPRRKGTERKKKKDIIMATGLIAYLIVLLIRIPLGRMIGDKGIGFFAAGMELFLVSTAVISYGISRAVAVLIKYRMKREQYKNAGKVFRSALLFSIISGGLFACILFVLSQPIAEILLLEKLSYLTIAAAAPAVMLSFIIGVLRGYFQGMGSAMPTVHSQLLERVIMFVSSLILASIAYAYGLKVAALLKNEEYAAAYGAMGSILGLTAACIFGALHLLFIYILYARQWKKQVGKDSSRATESGLQIVSMLFTTALPYSICALLYHMNYLVDQRIFNYAMNIAGKDSLRVAHWGVYYGKYSVVIGAAVVLCTLPLTGAVLKIGQLYDRQDQGGVREELGRSIHQLSIFSIPCAFLIAVLAEPIASILFKGDIKTAVLLIQSGSAVIVLASFTYFLTAILQRIRKLQIVMLGGLIAFLSHLILIILLLNNTQLGITAVVCGSILFYLASCVVCFFGVMRHMKYSQEWVRTFAVTLIAAGTSALIGMLLNKLLLSFAGNVITLLLCIVVYLITYHVFLIVLRGVRKEELEEMTGGNIITSIAVRLHLI